MRTLSLRFWLCGTAFVGLFGFTSVAVHPFGSVKHSEAHAGSATELHVPPEVNAMLKRACMDCHSSQTVWPWYSYVPPVSWLVEKDVSHGRDYMNFSDWDRYTFEQREKFFAEIASAVKNREMPLPQYTLVHRHAKLSDGDTDVLYGWARVQRRNLKAMFPVVTTTNSRQGAH